MLPAKHVEFAAVSKRSLSGDVARSLIRNRRRTWLLALMGMLVLGSVAWWARYTVDTASRKRISADLRAILDVSASGVLVTFEGYERDARFAAEDRVVRDALRSLRAVNETTHGDVVTLRAAPEQAGLQERLRFLLESGDYVAFSLTDPSGLVLATKTAAVVGTRPLTPAQYARLEHAEVSTVIPPFPHPTTEQPIMMASARVLEGGETRGWVHLIISPYGRFSELLKAARAGETGETYAFNRDGELLTRSRFRDSLKQAGLLDARADSAVLNVSLRDPGAEVNEADADSTDNPLTVMVQHAIKEGRGEDVEGYRGYRGSLVVGSWTWLDKYDIGVGTTIEVGEAFELREQLRRAVYALLALLTVATGGLVGYAYVLALAKRRSARAEKILQELGQYSLTKKLGEGGMGTVYAASHRMLRRPTAVKLIRGDQDEQVIRRFEREVQLTSQLTHPNTIMVYDYGRTAEGVFYYAMEYLEGTDVAALVHRFGPLPGGRAIHLLLQACGSLAEAHSRGLIHRDITGANLFVCERGGEFDVLKVLDFGLVKSQGAENEKLSRVDAVIGTPSYIAPETLTDSESASPRSDVYSLGIAAYMMLTGKEPFTGGTAMQICVAHMTLPPPPFSTFENVNASPQLQSVILRCLEKAPGDRPQDMLELATLLRSCPEVNAWTKTDAALWWASHEVRDTEDSRASIATGKTVMVVGGSVNLTPKDDSVASAE